MRANPEPGLGAHVDSDKSTSKAVSGATTVVSMIGQPPLISSLNPAQSRKPTPAGSRSVLRSPGRAPAPEAHCILMGRSLPHQPLRAGALADPCAGGSDKKTMAGFAPSGLSARVSCRIGSTTCNKQRLAGFLSSTVTSSPFSPHPIPTRYLTNRHGYDVDNYYYRQGTVPPVGGRQRTAKQRRGAVSLPLCRRVPRS